jgi:predicted acylesterase/phospholipase RssA
MGRGLGCFWPPCMCPAAACTWQALRQAPDSWQSRADIPAGDSDGSESGEHTVGLWSGSLSGESLATLTSLSLSLYNIASLSLSIHPPLRVTKCMRREQIPAAAAAATATAAARCRLIRLMLALPAHHVSTEVPVVVKAK